MRDDMDSKVFISYSHDSPEHENRVLELSDRLRVDGIDANIDQYQSAPPEGWQLWMEKEIRDSQFVLLVCTETYLRRVMKEEEQGKGLGVIWESTIAIQHLYNAGVVNEKFIPIVFGRENTTHIPMPLQPTTYYDVSTEEGYESLYRRLTNQPYTTKPKLGVQKKLAPRERKKGTSEVKVSLAKLPSTDPTLFGREMELIVLDDAWNNQQINVLSLVAWGGVGKSALVNKWLSQMARDNYRGAERVYGWSFYSQGAAEGRQVSADQFIAAALTWFGDPEMANSSASVWDKGERLAELIKGQRTLLILDGLEPLQNPPPVETGKIKDPGLTSLLRELARQNPGLVIISTRLAVDDLKDFIGSTAIEIDLEALSDESGAAYLAHLGVDGIDGERKEAAKDFGGHALALTLMGSYLKVVHRGDIRKRREIPHVMDEQKQGKHARRVMESYEVFLEGKPELDILRLMGLFDRPAEKGALEALRKEPAIAGLTDALQELKDAPWQFAVANLRDLRLLAAPDAIDPDELDCHPLLREHFGEQLKEANPAAWSEGNNRLYDYYKTSAKELPDTIQEMAPLFAAVMHGCQAGKHQEAYDEVFRKRIRRDQDDYAVKKLGTIGSELAVISVFFDSPWQKVVVSLREQSKGWLLNTAGFDLRSLGRLVEAAQPMKAGLEGLIARKDWGNAARQASNLSELYLTLGDTPQALAHAEQSVQLADRSGDAFMQKTNKSRLATALHQAGRLEEAGAAFREAEEVQKKLQPNFPILYTVSGFQYCDLLLSQEDYAEVEWRASQSLVLANEYFGKGMGLLDIALDNLSLGRAHLLQSQREPDHPFTEAATYLNHAVVSLRQTGMQDELPRGLLARAEYYRVTVIFDKAQKDLDEAFSIATRGGMGLFLADCHLEYARLYLAKDDKAKAREHWATAKESINKMGYHRRDKEVEETEEQLK
jgi:tetratricopeptide (TPR) repeat protein